MKKSYKWLLLITLTTLFSIALITGVASAAPDTMEEAELWADISEEINEAPAYEDEKPADRKWAISIGMAAGVSPDYEGSNDYGFGFGPNISASCGIRSSTRENRWASISSGRKTSKPV